MVNNNRWQILSALFDELLQRPPAERASCLAKSDHSEDIKREVLRMLQSVTESTGQLTAALEDVAHGLIERPVLLAKGQTLGSYQVMDTISQGGMGTVYRARHQDPSIQQEVAIKLTQSHFSDPKMKVRFYSERRILSQLSHRYIAKLFDVGETHSGHPYIIMEYIDGLPITQYCDSRELALDTRLHLFLEVCEAVQYAHQHGVIHRDLKPPNILVSDSEGRPLAKVIDFGIAFAEQHDPASVKSEAIGTPVYMSPEQFSGCGPVDTRTDIYALGVVLYELLGGVLPYDHDTLSSANFNEQKQLALPRLSLRLQNLSDTEPATTKGLAKKRQISFGQLKKKIINEFDWILTRATHHQTDQRYQTIGELKQDIECFLQHKPIAAKPGSLLYSTKKCFQRHPVASLSLITVILSTLIATITTSLALIKQQQAQAYALAEARQTQAVNQFMEEVLQAASNGKDGINTKIIDQLDNAVERAKESLKNSPLVQASVFFSIASSYSSYNRFSEALTLFKTALALRQKNLGEGHEKTLMVYKELGRLAYRQKDPQLAREIYEENSRRIEKYKGKNNTLFTANLVNLAGTYRRLAFYHKDEPQRFEHFLDLAVDACSMAINLLSAIDVHKNENDGETIKEQQLFAKNTLANVYRYQEKYQLAEKTFFEIAQFAKKEYGPLNLNYLVPVTNLSYTKKDLGDFFGAEQLMREVVKAYEKVRGPKHRITLEKIIAVGALLTLQEKYEEAEKLLVYARTNLIALDLPKPERSKISNADHWLAIIRDKKQP